MKSELWLDKRFRDRPDAGLQGRNPASALRRWQILKLAETIDWAGHNSAFFQRAIEPRLAAATVAGLKKAAEGDEAAAGKLLAALPFCTPKQLAADPGLFLAVGQDEVAGVVSVPSSGTSGPAKRIFSTDADLEETVTFFEYGLRFLVEPGADRLALAMSPARPGNVGDLLERALKRLNIPFLAHGFAPAPGGEEEWLAELIDWRPSCLVGVPPQMLALSRQRRAAELGRSLKTILLSGDVADEALVAELEKNFGCRVFRHYGSTETGLGGAVECGQRLWPHLRDDLWVEIVDEEGRPLPDGPGEIVITPLTRRGMPLLRYRSGDEGELLNEACPCGSLMPRLKVFGRLADRFRLPGGRLLRASDFEAPLLALPFVRDYRPAYRPGKPPLLRLTLALTEDHPAEAVRLAEESIKCWLGREADQLTVQIGIWSGENESGVKALGGKRHLEWLND